MKGAKENIQFHKEEMVVLPERIVVQGPMEIEVGELLKALEPDSIVEKKTGSHIFYEGLLSLDDASNLEAGTNKAYTNKADTNKACANKYVTVIVSRTYIGMVNAAQATVLAANFLRPTAIINQGVAGGHVPELRRGDLIIGTEAVNISAVITSVRGRGEGHDISSGELRDTEIPINVKDDELTVVKRFPCDRDWIAAARRTAPEYFMPIEARTNAEPVKSQECGAWTEGVIGSADCWNKELDEINDIHRLTGSLCEEMESSATAQVCMSYGIPFFVARILSNNEWTNEEYDPETALKCQKFIIDTIREYCRMKYDLCK